MTKASCAGSQGLVDAHHGAEVLWTRDFILICLANLVVFLGFKMLMPTMPVYVESLGGRKSVQGLVMGVFTLSAVVIRPPVGWLLDTIGRKVALLFGLVVFAISAALYGWVSSIGLLLIIRVIHGFGWGFSTTASGTIAADVVPRTRLAEGMGYFGLASTVAMAVAPALGLFIAGSYGFPLLFGTSAGLALTALGLASLVREHGPHGREIGRDSAAVQEGRGRSPASRAAFYEPKAVLPGAVVFLSNMSYGAIVTFLALYARERGIANIGPFFGVFAVVIAFARPLLGAFADRRGFDTVVIPGLIAVAVSMVLLSWARSLATFFLAAVVAGAGFAAVQPSMQALAVRGLPAVRRGAANSTFYIGFDLGIGVGAMLLGVISEFAGYSGMYLAAGLPPAFALAVYSRPGSRARGGGKGDSTPTTEN
ncbi:MAG: MFS transporter [Bacillota bacterium]